jgi:phosphoribosylformimino-5-aminoimidazole carboxamide ribotide isomerase
MLIIPAIDLKDGQCVRLKQGLMEQATVFSDSPAEAWRAIGLNRAPVACIWST